MVAKVMIVGKIASQPEKLSAKARASRDFVRVKLGICISALLVSKLSQTIPLHPTFA